MYHTPPHPFHPHPPHPAAGATFPPQHPHPYAHHQAMESGPLPPHLFNPHYINHQSPHHARHDSHPSDLSSSNFSTSPIMPLPPHVRPDLLPFPQMPTQIPMQMPMMGSNSASPSPPSMILPPHPHPHMRNNSAPYMHQMTPPVFQQPVLYSSPATADQGPMQHQPHYHPHHYSTATATPPQPTPLLPPLLPQFANPYQHHQHPDRSHHQRMDSQQHPYVLPGYPNTAAAAAAPPPLPPMMREGDERRDRSRLPSGPATMHSRMQMQKQQVPPIPGDYGVTQQGPHPSFGTYDPSYSPSNSSPMHPIPQPSPRYTQHTAQNEGVHTNMMGASSASTSPRQGKQYSPSATPAINQSSPTYSRRGSILRNTNKGMDGNQSPFAKRNYQQRTPTKPKRPYYNNNNMNDPQTSYQGQGQNMSSSSSSPFYGHDMSDSRKNEGLPYRSYGRRRASIASSGSTTAATVGNGNGAPSTSSGQQERMHSGNGSPATEFAAASGRKGREGSKNWKGYQQAGNAAEGGWTAGEADGRADADVANHHESGLGNSNEATNWQATKPLLTSTMLNNSTTEEEESYLQYRVCMNPSCPNIFHYTQQIYQPMTTPHSHSSHVEASRRKGYPTNATTTTFTLVDVPCMIQPPAWCELNPCGCTFCRDCFTFTISQCQSIPPDVAQGQYEAVKIFTCMTCDAEVREFGPVNEEVQNVVESGKALYAENYEDTQHYLPVDTSFDASYAQQVDEGETTLNDLNTGVQSAASAPRIVFDGFQSAQDLISGQSEPSKQDFMHTHATNRSGYSSTTSNTTSPLLQSPSKTGVRYAKSDPPPSLPSLSPLVPHQEIESQEVSSSVPNYYSSSAYGGSSEQAEAGQDRSTPDGRKSVSTAEASTAFPTLSKIEVISLPDRKISTSTVDTTTSFDSSLFETPDLGASSSSSASTSALNSPVTFNSPVTTLDTLPSQSLWRQKAVPRFHEGEEKSMETGVHRDARLEQDFAKLAVLAKKSEDGKEPIEQSSTGLGLTFGTVTPSRGSRGIEAASTPTKNRLDNAKSLPATSSSASAISASAQPPQTPERQTMAPRDCDMISPPQKMPPPTPRSIHVSNMDSTSPTSHIKNRLASRAPDDMTPSRAYGGRGRGRGRGGFANHTQIRTETQHENHAHKPSSSTVSFGSIRSRTDTQSSTQTTTSSSSSSQGGSIHQLHNRKVSMAENKSPRLPDLLANPSEEMKFVWEENKKKWWRDPWNGKLLGVKQKLVGAERCMIRTDGSPLIKGRGSGVSWPILKVHNIHFRTTIADIESFVPPGVLAPLEYNAQGIHILCDAADGKTRPYAYIECISAQAAGHLVSVSDGKYLAGRQVAFRPVTQKELALDLFRHLKKGGYYKDTILAEDSTRSGGSNHQRQLSLYESAKELDLFTEQDDQQLRRLFDVALGDAVGDERARDTTEAGTSDLADPAMLFSFPTERPFARLASMIVKFPCHAMVGPTRTSEKHVQTVNRMFACLLHAMHKMAPYVNERPSLRAILDRLYCAGLQCPAFDERKGNLNTMWAKITKAKAL